MHLRSLSFAALFLLLALLWGCYPHESMVVTNAMNGTTANGSIVDLSKAAHDDHGFVYATTHNPTMPGNTSVSLGPVSKTGDFSASLTGLTVSTWYVRAFLKEGSGYLYGEEVSLTFAALSVNTSMVSEISSTSATCGGTVTGDGGNAITARGVCWSSSNVNPTTADSKTSDGTGIGTFTSTLTGLTAGVIYYVRAYASNSEGTVYGSTTQFSASAILPTIVTTLGSITTTAAIGGGNVTNDGGATVSARGVCWSSTNATPTIANSTKSSGVGTGAYICTLTGLSPGTTYYVRAWATNSAGTAYGNVVIFATTTTTTPNYTQTVNGISFSMIQVPAGTFQMGCTSEQSDCYSDETPVHSVTLSGYYVGETEVTQALWQAVMGSNPSYFNTCPTCPVELVNRDDCQTFIAQLNALTGKTYRLPTEAEWEFAARGTGTQTLYAGSNTADGVAWYYDNSSSQTHPVKQKAPNSRGIYDMSGNVWEWCSDWLGAYNSGDQANPTGPATGSYRVFRGGSWNFLAADVRVAFRGSDDPGSQYGYLGFRLARTE